MSQLPLRVASSVPWYSQSLPTTPPYTAPPTSNNARSLDTLPPVATPPTSASSTIFDGYHDAVDSHVTGWQRTQSLEHKQYSSWRQYSKYYLPASDNHRAALGHANMTQQQMTCPSRTSSKSRVFSDRPASPTLIMAVPIPSTLPYAIVSHERIHSAPPYSALSATSLSIVAENRYEGSTYDKTAQSAGENFWTSGKEHDHKRNDRDIAHLLQKQSFEGANNCENAEMTDRCGRHQHDTSSCPRHSETCLLSSPGFFRPLPSPDSFTAPVEMQQGTPPSIFASPPLSNDLYPPNSTHSSSRPLPQLRTPSYGIQTSHVRDLPRYTSLGPRDALGNEDATFRMTLKNLPPIQTVLDGFAKPAHMTDASDSKDDYWNDQPCFKYLSYPSPSSSLDAMTYKSPLADPLAPYLTSRKYDLYGGATEEIPQRDGRTKAYVQAVQIDSLQQHANGTPVDNAQKQWTLQDHARLAARVWNKRSTPSSFTSSDIERASSIESQFDQENHYEPESETTIFLGGFCATSPDSSSLISTEARLSYSATSAALSVFTPAEHPGSSIMFSSSETSLRRSTSGGAMQEPFPGSRRVFMRPPSAVPTNSSGGDSSGSDCETSVMRKKPDSRPNTREAKTHAKPPSMKIRKHENSKNKMAPEVARNKKRSRRSVQRKTSLSTSKERLFKCDYCSMAFHRRHDMKRHARLHTGERPYKCPSKTCGEAFERNDQLRRHLERTDACRKKAPSLSEHSFCQGAIRKKRR